MPGIDTCVHELMCWGHTEGANHISQAVCVEGSHLPDYPEWPIGQTQRQENGQFVLNVVNLKSKQ